ncbi:MAG: JAB domain-containing protein [Myxococcales bacterium]|nr:JAB domain-containing protein [Myxococcales bacterium]
MNGDWFEAHEVVEPKEPTRFFTEAQARLRRLGAASLTDGELLAVLGGAKDERDVEPLLTHGLAHLLETPELSFELAPLLTARLLASMELAYRLPQRKLERPKLFTPHAIAAWARTQLVQRRLEETWVLSLNTRNVLLRFDRVSTGGVDHCVIDAREALAPAVACRASGLVLLHTHPGGDPEPSAQDVAMTRKLKVAAQQLNITLLDHVVLSDTGYLSMLEKGLLDSARGSALMRRPILADEDD